MPMAHIPDSRDRLHECKSSPATSHIVESASRVSLPVVAQNIPHYPVLVLNVYTGRKKRICFFKKRSCSVPKLESEVLIHGRKNRVAR
jgi:hypothetical protein